MLECAVNWAGDWFKGANFVAGTNGAFIDVEPPVGLARHRKILASSLPISGPGTLTKLGLGTLDLGATNTYAGGTVINNGVLQAQSDLSLGAPAEL